MSLRSAIKALSLVAVAMAVAGPAAEAQTVSARVQRSLNQVFEQRVDGGVRVDGTPIFIWSQTPAVANFNIGISSPYASTAHDNFFIGLNSGGSCTTCIGNLGIGHSALAVLVDGINNLAIGWDSQLHNSHNQDNVSVAEDALKFIGNSSADGLVGNYNTAIGYAACYTCDLADNNFIGGTNAFHDNSTGSGNVVIGSNAVGSAGADSGSEHVIIGYQAGLAMTGARNTFLGYQSGRTGTSFTDNVFVGHKAGWYETGSNTFMLDNQQRSDEASARQRALAYGFFDPTPLNQFITFNSKVNIGSIFNLGVVSTDGLVLQNTTAATGGTTVQMSPRLKFRGNAWDTSANETVDFFIENLPATAATPTGTLKFGYSLNGAGATYPVTFTSAGQITTLGSIFVPNSGGYFFNGRTVTLSAADGLFSVNNNAQTRGATIKVDALPTVGSGFGTSPSITAGSTPFAGSVNVGTGGSATSGVITWGGTAFPSAPFCTYSTTNTNAVTRGTPTTTQLTLNSTTAWSASDIVSWICVSSR